MYIDNYTFNTAGMNKLKKSYIYNRKFITNIYQRQQNNRKTVFVIGKLGTDIWRGLNLH